ncbi:MAG: MBL fold metallo-hydrolase [Bacteroidota bacterium]
MSYKITAYSTALFSTWINVEELGLLIDAGDGVSAGLLQKSRKVKHVFITHPDRDHLTGLPQFIQLNARKDWPKVYYPSDSRSFPAMRDFLRKFDPHIPATDWLPVEDGSQVEIKKQIVVEAMRNEHIKCPVGVHKSLSYKAYEVKHKLKPEFLTLSGREIKDLITQKGREYAMQPVRTNIVSFSGDTPVDDYAKWDGSQILIHEATFLKPEGDTVNDPRINKHSHVDEVLKMVSEINVDKLILSHFSTRYNREEIDNAVRKYIKAYQIKIPVYLIYPGEVKRDVLNGEIVNE